MMTASIMDLSGAVLIGIPGLFLLKNPHQAIPRQSALSAAPSRISVPKRLY